MIFLSPAGSAGGTFGLRSGVHDRLQLLAKLSMGTGLMPVMED